MVEEFLDHMLELRIENIDATTLFLYFQLFYPTHAPSYSRADIVGALDAASHPTLQRLADGRYTIVGEGHEERARRRRAKRVVQGFMRPMQEEEEQGMPKRLRQP